MILDGGPTQVGVESTVLDLTVNPPMLLRPGGVPLERLAETLGEVRFERRTLPVDAAQASPGMLLKHYSPRAEVLLIAGEPARLATVAGERLTAGKRVAALLFDGESQALDGLDVEIATLGSATDPAMAAGRLFGELRRLDRIGVDVILARAPARNGLGLAVWDRLFRAAEGRVDDG